MAHQTRAEKIRKERAAKRALKTANFTAGPKRSAADGAGGPNLALRAMHKAGLHHCGNPGCARCFPRLAVTP